MNLSNVSIGGFLLAVFSLVTLILLHSLFAENYAGLAIQILAAALMIWARLTFRTRSFHAAANPTEGGLVTTGPYKYFRHPIYAAVLYFMWAGIMTHLSLMSLSLGVLGSAGLVVRMLAEERLVVERYPEYAEYAARTKRVIPFVL